MKKIPFLRFAAIVLIFCAAVGISAQTRRKSVSAKEATGTFKMKFTGKFEGIANEIRLLPLGKGKIKVAFDLVYPYIIGDGELTANTGMAEGIANIEADTAVYESSEFGECRITIKFIKPGKIEVTQDSGPPACGFGHNVTANGTYERTSKKKPEFGKNEIK